jgi:hypothetical protein
VNRENRMQRARAGLPVLAILALGTLTTGCQFIARGPDQYRDDTQAVLESKLPDVKACYDSALKADKTLAGNVKVKFTVEQETGVIKNVSVDPGGTTAPANITECVTQSLQGLALDPADARDGEATFTYEFKVG